ncbi:MAG TPA: UDP-3-O-acyl-N-acetylglucosamine deacetylase [Alphaproteobacteria bacterium]|nr:UDP-3-O-acyl-N-acetylglucosamine deacetylase [Alphaproteobacteria bacterium]
MRGEEQILQQTLKTPISCSGIGLHSGAKVTMTLQPAEPNSGILFRRTDAAGLRASIPATWRHVVDTRMCTTLGAKSAETEGEVRIGTVEHLLAAVAGSHIDNLLIELNGPEVPVMDGSAAPFMFLFDCAGVVEQTAQRSAIQILKHVAVGNHEAMATLSPGSGFSVSCEIDFEAPAIARQEYFVSLENGAFRSEIARARTFGFVEDVRQLRAAGLALGGSLDNAVVVDGDRVINADGLRYEDEFVRHKVLDAVGDLSLAGAPILGHFHGYRSGHSMHNRLLRALFADREAWRLVPLENRRQTGGVVLAGSRRVAATA